jgi:hypothetical protein
MYVITSAGQTHLHLIAILPVRSNEMKMQSGAFALSQAPM